MKRLGLLILLVAGLAHAGTAKVEPGIMGASPSPSPTLTPEATPTPAGKHHHKHKHHQQQTQQDLRFRVISESPNE